MTLEKNVVIMAGGIGSRMKSPLPKQLLNVKTKPMLFHIFENLEYIQNKKHQLLNVILVLSTDNNDITIQFLNNCKNIKIIDNIIYFNSLKITYVIQDSKKYKGTGGALLACKNEFKKKDNNENVLVLSADVPLITKDTILKMFSIENYEASLLYRNSNDNYGYGRVYKYKNGYKIVEHKDCNEEELKIKDINTGIYCFKISSLLNALDKIDNNNSQNEYYLTDTIKYIKNVKGICYEVKTYNETLGANTPEQLTELEENYMKKFTIEDINDNKNNLTNENIGNLLETLNQLSPTKEKDYDLIRKHIENTKNNETNKMKIFVLKYENEIIGSGSVIIETKILRNISKVGHIEDIVINDKFRKLGLSKLLIENIIQFCKDENCYKILLDCNDTLINFYEKYGFKKNANTMRFDIIN